MSPQLHHLPLWSSEACGATTAYSPESCHGVYFFFAMGGHPLSRFATVSSAFLQKQHKGWKYGAIAMTGLGQLVGSLFVP
eukprot:7885911-Ditylum_brightwellii.AAC.1